MVKILGFIILFFCGWCYLSAGINFPRLGLPVGRQAFGQVKDGQTEQIKGRVNPFLTQKEEKVMVEMGNVTILEYLNVSAIFYSSFNSQSRAIIDGKVLVLGNSIDNKEIIKINPENVVLEDSQGQYVAKMAELVTNTAKSE